MADFAPPAGPPPPQIPQGWKAVWNEQYKEWFYVNTFTKKSQWEKPTEPVYGPPDDEPPEDAPPGYDHSQTKPVGPEKSGAVSSNTTGGQLFAGDGAAGSSSHVDTSGDEEFARKLQEEENARLGGSVQGPPGDRGEADNYYNQGPGAGGPAPYGQQSGGPYGSQSPAPYDPSQISQNQSAVPSADARGKSKGGFLGKLLGKAKGSSQQPAYAQQYPQQGYNYGSPQPGYGYPPQQGYYAQGGYPVQQARPQRHGLGAGSAAALGVGGGLLGGVLLADAMDGGDGGDFGGDDGGGDFGGDF
ncbi:uncharacterized protein PV09_09220 [Verruconis gallopava]|uniref:WW domain-containing protein n=1 Tax=Verruconis gallopava TaxID=253628 RepID=A0A0D1ZX88_9PEZI|nr:uncharacterized protein PV09_09220 [Verruconis gallopava]KIV99047.1 hypothetical protein PV09_09220 [Verruconis gallopava]